MRVDPQGKPAHTTFVCCKIMRRTVLQKHNCIPAEPIRFVYTQHTSDAHWRATNGIHRRTSEILESARTETNVPPRTPVRFYTGTVNNSWSVHTYPTNLSLLESWTDPCKQRHVIPATRDLSTGQVLREVPVSQRSLPALTILRQQIPTS